MIYYVPKKKDFLEVVAGDYICDTRFKHIQKVKPSIEGENKGYLKPCEKCGCRCFYGFK